MEKYGPKKIFPNDHRNQQFLDLVYKLKHFLAKKKHDSAKKAIMEILKIRVDKSVLMKSRLLQTLDIAIRREILNQRTLHLVLALKNHIKCRLEQLKARRNSKPLEGKSQKEELNNEKEKMTSPKL